ncbi:MAG: (Fe-S)-binding protein [Acidimicrobiia bacterium]|nr:(Fe-S)-binding protein [Acidimicrobiia bacterium]
MTLTLDGDDLAACVSCGLCLPHCPTFRATGDEARSPRGRITAMRLVVAGGSPMDAPFVDAMETCIQCRGCEPACPSGVPFGRLMASTRAQLAPHGIRRRVYRLLAVPALVRAASLVAAVGQRLRLVPSDRLGLPRRLPLRRPALAASGTDVWLFTGCVMDAWQRPVHVAAARLIESTGNGVALPPRGAGCCGALADHAGAADEARRRALATMAAMPGDAPIVVDSAGCGAMLQHYGEAIATDAARRFSARVVDVSTWLTEHRDQLPPARPGHVRRTFAVQDPCHLRHVQGAHGAVRTLLAPYADVTELDDDGLCCGAGGAFSIDQPELADQVRTRKLASIARSGAQAVVSANPGCSVYLERAGIEVHHPVVVAATAAGLVEGDATRGR